MNLENFAVWHSGATVIPSPNFDQRPEGASVDLIVIHSISLPPGQYGGKGIEQLFTNQLDADEHPYYAQVAGLKVSSHFLIKRDGELVQFVPVAQRAWHAGVSCWKNRERCNDFSIGIELEGDDDTPFESVQYLTLTHLLAALTAQWPITAITSHSHIAPGRKTDPGPYFDWAQVEKAFPTIGVVR